MYKREIHTIVVFCCLSCFLWANSSFVFAQKSQFTVVIDAGHGGRDPGALGNLTQEKDITLAVALRIGKKIQANHADVQVLYTREKDIYPTLIERTNYANNNNADLYISIHTNSVASRSSAPNGSETFVLGIDKVQSNLDVAMCENSVILLEDDYQTKYQGFNPNSVESYIMFEFMQDQYWERSISLATCIQQNLSTLCHQTDRGVKQAPLWVLHKVACPSVLVELGFITNKKDENYMCSDKGRDELATAIYKAFSDYKHEIDRKSGKVITEWKDSKIIETETDQQESQPSVETTKQDHKKTKPIYKVQIFSVKQELKKNDPTFKGIKKTDFYNENGYYKYTVGEETDFEQIEAIRKKLKNTFPDAFVVAFFNGKKISVKEAKAMQ